MKHRLWIGLLVFCVGGTAGIMAERLLHAQNEPIKRTSLLQTELEGVPDKEVDVFIVEIAPGASTGRHSHPGSEIAYILEGTAGVEADGNNFPITHPRAGSVVFSRRGRPGGEEPRQTPPPPRRRGGGWR